MSIQMFELFHGAILAKLMRNDRPVALRMIETSVDSWSVYKINDEVSLFIKHSISPRELSREKGGLAWQFVFSVDQVAKICYLHLTGKVAVALVCGRQNVRDGMHVAFIEPGEIQYFLKLSQASPQSLTVKFAPRKQLRIMTVFGEEILVPQNALDTWEVPGS